MTKFKKLTLSSLVAMLAACGGGSGSSSTQLQPLTGYLKGASYWLTSYLSGASYPVIRYL